MSILRGTLRSELEQIGSSLVQMGKKVVPAILQAIDAFTTGNVALAQQVIDGDKVINQLRFEIEHRCFTLLATQQPAAIDLRTVVTALNIITDLERMGDYAKGIGEIVIRTNGQNLSLPQFKIPHMAETVCDMLSTALDAFVEGDVEKAQSVFDLDDHVDHMYREIFEAVIQSMVDRDRGVQRGMYLLFAAHNLERIGDRVTNIGERVIFMQTGVMAEKNL
jgi:phosphate transport system protein